MQASFTCTAPMPRGVDVATEIQFDKNGEEDSKQSQETEAGARRSREGVITT